MRARPDIGSREALIYKTRALVCGALRLPPLKEGRDRSRLEAEVFQILAICSRVTITGQRVLRQWSTKEYTFLSNN
ncbi:hypothetical protein RRG08_008767 [Elysia crispata]|uniref:Uncharacterized protein n=1 Tax=Elysia crispata TaxID=231223 RepID=A0AAE0YPT3_9GAST|nr:hypothetical protein RRG08_008767 [Elysia crispata]